MTDTYDIYFNENKEAFAYEIENPICAIKSDVWAEFAGTDKWDIVEGKFMDLSKTKAFKEKELTQAKEDLYKENDSKAEAARTSRVFTIEVQGQECEFDTKVQTQTDLLTAFAVCSTGNSYDEWVCNNGVTLNLTLDDVLLISNKFKELSNVYPRWNHYKQLIDDAKNLKELNAIIIDYEVELEIDK